MLPSWLRCSELKQWLNVATPAARNIVRKILTDSREPLHTQEIFQRSQRDFVLQPAEAESQTALHARLLQRKNIPPPPNPIHHIRSVAYLKNVVLPDLETRQEILKIHRLRLPTPEERETLATRPPQRTKRRTAASPGKQPPRLTNGQISEWVWRLKTSEDVQREAYHEQLNREIQRHAEQQRKEVRIHSLTMAKRSRHTRTEKSQQEYP